MTYQEYLMECIKLLNENPHWAELPICFAADDEGNTFQRTSNLPQEMLAEDPTEYYLEMEDREEDQRGNVICIN